MPINRELIERKISLILDDLKRLKELSSLTVDDYMADPRNEALAERYLERMIGRLLDINFHIVTEVTLTTPRDYFDSFQRLGSLDALSQEQVARFSRLAGLRNRIAHEYNGLDEKLIYQTIKDLITELPAYLKAIERYLG